MYSEYTCRPFGDPVTGGLIANNIHILACKLFICRFTVGPQCGHKNYDLSRTNFTFEQYSRLVQCWHLSHCDHCVNSRTKPDLQQGHYFVTNATKIHYFLNQSNLIDHKETDEYSQNDKRTGIVQTVQYFSATIIIEYPSRR